MYKITTLTLLFIAFLAVSCTAGKGCPSNGNNIGAERIMSGEKLPKSKKFRA